MLFRSLGLTEAGLPQVPPARQLARHTHTTPTTNERTIDPYLPTQHKYRKEILYARSPPAIGSTSNMASLNTSTNGPSIRSSYQGVVNSPPPSGAAANSPTYAQWALFSVSAPLINAFQQDSGSKESVLKVQSTGGMLFRRRNEEWLC